MGIYKANRTLLKCCNNCNTFRHVLLLSNVFVDFLSFFQPLCRLDGVRSKLIANRTFLLREDNVLSAFLSVLLTTTTTSSSSSSSPPLFHQISTASFCSISNVSHTLHSMCPSTHSHSLLCLVTIEKRKVLVMIMIIIERER